jgi:prepilin-type processing-associated H-X9-DG protein
MRAPRPAYLRRGFTRVEATVVGIVVVLLLAFVIFVKLRVDTTDKRVECAKNLRQIGQALLLYSNDNKGAFPRVRFSGQGGKDPDPKPTFGTAPMAPQPFADDGPAPNDVTAALFLLARHIELIPQRFVCPSSSNSPDNFDPQSAKRRSNFTDYRKNLSYSYNNPYPSTTAIGNGFKMNNTLSAEFAVAADKNPGAPRTNGKIHRNGQNVLFGDGHVAFETTPLCGVNKDDIYTTADGKLNASSVDANDSILLPAED